MRFLAYVLPMNKKQKVWISISMMKGDIFYKAAEGSSVAS